MQLINWNKTYEGGVIIIDEQHHKLVDLINALHDAMMVGNGAQILGPLFDDLIDYTKYHFDYEEKWMQDNGYPNLSAHKLLHATLTNQVIEFKVAFESKKLTNAVTTNNFLKHWLIDHILEEDFKVMKSLKF